MAKIAKMTIYVQQSRHGQFLSVRTVGARGSVQLNTVKVDKDYNSQSPSANAVVFWEDVLALVLAAVGS